MKRNECGASLFRRRAGTSIQERAARVVAVAIAVPLCLAWFVSTIGTAAGQELTLLLEHHAVVLKWKPSPTPNVKYNVYRSTVQGSDYKKLNSRPLAELKYMDKDVRRGSTYYYVTRSVDGGGTESANSNEAKVTIP